MIIDIKPTDKLFRDSPDVGPQCICSRCGKPIESGVPIRAWPRDNLEYRFHPECLGFRTISYYTKDDY